MAEQPSCVVAQPQDLFDIQDLFTGFPPGFHPQQQQAAAMHDPDAAPGCPESSDNGQCWGALLTGGSMCTPGFHIGKLHFKNKYCENVSWPPAVCQNRAPHKANPWRRVRSAART